ncbi:ribonuclease domain-containing protein, partial [Enterococcus faecalis]|uniref:ribonuclease domain-containing protein n=1 Tax=Enterococcus faecalis TaxID=1351 RepID=UPI003987B186
DYCRSGGKDGKVYGNGTNPKLPNGPTYTEWVVPTQGVNGRGPQRIVVGSDGSMWYSPNHYGDIRPDMSRPISQTNKP